MSAYWSNLNKDEDIIALARDGELPKNVWNMIYNPVRANGLKLLDIKKDDIGVDYGCGWGALTIPASNKCKALLAIDQTRETITFLDERRKREKNGSIVAISVDLMKWEPFYNGCFKNNFDFAIVNGVLEWIPVREDVELKEWFKKKPAKLCQPSKNPRATQLEFLKMVYKNLKEGGKLYLAIENRYSWKYLFKKDEHSNLMFTSLLPRKWANLICNLWYGRPYLTYTYSYDDLMQLLCEAGFELMLPYSAYPDYRFPKIVKRNAPKYCPSFIIIARK